MRPCPVCEMPERTEVFRMTYRVPDGWPLPSEIVWYTCDSCGMIYGDGDFDQALLDRYYKERYGAGLNFPENVERLRKDAWNIVKGITNDCVVVDFGGGGEGGKSILVEHLKSFGCTKAFCVGVGESVPECNVIFASHVLEHVYDLPRTMAALNDALLIPDGLLIVDVPDAAGAWEYPRMPIIDFNTKHVNHFTARHLLDLGYRHGFEATSVRHYQLQEMGCLQVRFKRIDVALKSASHVWKAVGERVLKLRAIKQPVNVWGLADLAWHLLSLVDLDVLDYVDSDPAYRGSTYKGKPVLERPTNDAPIVVMVQRQGRQIVESIKKLGLKNEVIFI